jgi:hypothetical protein
MGNWNITVQGTGCHHNRDNPSDADRLAAEFVERLKAAGHTLVSATFTAGSRTDLPCGPSGRPIPPPQ